MKWWNDLWLNESFAEWASTLATAEATEWTRGLDHVLTRWRRAGPTARTSCPRRTRSSPTSTTSRTCRSTSTASPTPRARSVLKQLVAWVGQDAVLRRRRARTSRSTRGATPSCADLLAELEATSGRDLSRVVRAVARDRRRQHAAPGDRGRRRRHASPSFAVLQEAPRRLPDHPPAPPGDRLLRPRATARSARVPHRVETRRRRRRAPRSPSSSACTRPALVLLNDDDLAYAKIRLDDASLAVAIEHLADIDDPLARSLVWGAAWDATRDAETPRQRLRRPRARQHRARDRVDDVRTTLDQLRHGGRAPTWRPSTRDADDRRGRRRAAGARAGRRGRLATRSSSS